MYFYCCLIKEKHIYLHLLKCFIIGLWKWNFCPYFALNLNFLSLSLQLSQPQCMNSSVSANSVIQ